jgi:hypothetical protein
MNAYKAGWYLQLSLILFVFGPFPLRIMWSLSMSKVLIFLGYDDENGGNREGICYAICPYLSLWWSLHWAALHVRCDGHEMESTIMTGLAEVGTTSVLALFSYCKHLFPSASLVDLGYVYLACKLLYL